MILTKVDGMYITVITMKMHESSVQVSLNAILMPGVAYAHAYILVKTTILAIIF